MLCKQPHCTKRLVSRRSLWIWSCFDIYIVALYALRVEYGHCRIRVDTASGKSWAVDLLNYGMLLGSPAAQQLRNCPAACIHGVAPRSMQVNVKQR